MEKAKKKFNIFLKSFEYLSAATLALMTILISLQVLFRYVLNSPLAWTEELARYVFIWTTFIASFVAAVKGEHVAITMLGEKLKGLIRAELMFVANLVSSIFLFVVCYTSLAQWSKLSIQTSAALKIPISYVYLGIIIGTGFMAIWYLYLGVKVLAVEIKNKVSK